MADNTYQPGTYRERGGDRFVVASSGSMDVESGGEIDIESGGRLEIGGTAFISSGGKVDLSSGRNWTSTGGIYTAGPIEGGSLTSTGAITGSSGLAITAASTFSSNLTVGGALTVSSGVAVTAASTFSGNLTVAGALTVSSGMGVTAASTFSGNLTVAGALTVSSGLGVTAASTFSAAIAAKGGMTSTGAITGISFTSTGAVTGGFVHLLETVATTVATALSNYGVSILGSSSLTENQNHTIAPVTGVEKFLIVVSSVTSASVNVVTTGTWDGTNNKLTFATTSGATETRIHAVATSTSRWRLLFVTASSNYSLATT